eukprot:CAMPEP_0203895894 /NCGR_PEP_ID=MMETSP0359-20131031/38695_1 /ASSEMBLY_ACC=CAM_ASM_000338 /TAXON_ID=268821 /ORGANISM="Scrippsiella Hangoei, Strain SHTV-5" /LENGTH=44 /DNA_ID= /DNA_START= /DNA_END= /DNA_ORIENTATION=
MEPSAADENNTSHVVVPPSSESAGERTPRAFTSTEGRLATYGRA